jgi:hypothetical protein
MECVKRGCSRTALRGSNYCRLHQPHNDGSSRPSGRKTAKKKMAKKKK